jgi:hypothetical protein
MLPFSRRLAQCLHALENSANRDQAKWNLCGLRSFCEGLVLPDRIELSTSPLPMECSTTELRQHAPDDLNRAEKALSAG